MHFQNLVTIFKILAVTLQWKGLFTIKFETVELHTRGHLQFQPIFRLFQSFVSGLQNYTTTLKILIFHENHIYRLYKAIRMYSPQQDTVTILKSIILIAASE